MSLVHCGSSGSRDYGAFLLTPLRWGLVHVLLEEAIEVLHEVVAQNRCNHTDLGCRKYAEQPSGECEARLYLEFRHGHMVLADEGPLQRSHFHSKLSGNGPEPQLHIAVRGKD